MILRVKQTVLMLLLHFEIQISMYMYLYSMQLNTLPEIFPLCADSSESLYVSSSLTSSPSCLELHWGDRTLNCCWSQCSVCWVAAVWLLARPVCTGLHTPRSDYRYFLLSWDPSLSLPAPSRRQFPDKCDEIIIAASRAQICEPSSPTQAVKLLSVINFSWTL